MSWLPQGQDENRGGGRGGSQGPGLQMAARAVQPLLQSHPGPKVLPPVIHPWVQSRPGPLEGAEEVQMERKWMAEGLSPVISTFRPGEQDTLEFPDTRNVHHYHHPRHLLKRQIAAPRYCDSEDRGGPGIHICHWEIWAPWLSLWAPESD